MTSFMHSRSQRFELEMRNIPAGVDVVVLPRPTDARELFDFSGGRELIDEAHRLARERSSIGSPRPRCWRKATETAAASNGSGGRRRPNPVAG